MREKTAFGLLLVLSLLVFAEGLSWVTASWPSPCLITIENDDEAAYNNNQKSCPTFHVGTEIFLSRLDKFIAGHDKSIVAAFTIVLAVSTIGLWLATVRLWEAGERQLELIADNASKQSSDMQASIAAAKKAAEAADLSARAAIGVESPIIQFDRPDLYYLAVPFPETGPIGGPVQAGTPSRYSGVGWIVMRNGGRTAAYPSSLHVGWTVTDDLPEIPIYKNIHEFQRGSIIREDNVKSDPYFQLQIRLTITLTDEQIAALAKETASLWLYCRLHYTNFLDEHYDAKACWVWAKGREGAYYWSGDGYPPAAYEGQRRIS